MSTDQHFGKIVLTVTDEAHSKGRRPMGSTPISTISSGSPACGTLDPIEHFELWYWATLTAGTNAYNACLHLAGITPADPVFSTIPGVHLVQQPDGATA